MCCLRSLHSTKKTMSSCPNVSSVNVGTVCLGIVSTWLMHKSATRWSQVVPWCSASGDLATRAVPLRWRIEPVTAKQIWNHATLCHKFLHSTAREPFFAHLWAKTSKRWCSLTGKEQGESEDVSHYSCSCHTVSKMHDPCGHFKYLHSYLCIHKMWLQPIKHDERREGRELSRDVVVDKVT